MTDEVKATKPPPAELAELRQEIAGLKKSEARYKRAMEALLKSEGYFKSITQNSSDLIIITNSAGKITYVNSSVEHILGYTLDELIGKSSFDYILPADIPRAADDYGEAIRTKDVIIPNAFRVRHKDGSEHVLEGVGTNLLDEPAVNGFVMNVHDITERVKAEEELHVYRKHLEDLVEQRTSELTTINSRLLVELTERQRLEKALRESD